VQDLAASETKVSGQPKAGLAGKLVAAGFTNVNLVERDSWFCVLASKP
jgi:hypothetical protein